MTLLDTIKSLFFGEKSEVPVVTEQAEEVVIKKEPVKAAPVQSKPVASTIENTGIQIPEDTALIRHFISALQIEIESAMPTRPTDSALKRHYDSAVQAKLAVLLAG